MSYNYITDYNMCNLHINKVYMFNSLTKYAPSLVCFYYDNIYLKIRLIIYF